jgi:hypothetical protein
VAHRHHRLFEAGSVLNFILSSKFRPYAFALAFVGVTVFLVIPSAFAQENSGAGAGKKGQKRTTINFEDQLIEGRTQKPELIVLLQNRMNNSRRLFKLRENFLPEMRKTAEDVGRAESNARGSAEPAK